MDENGKIETAILTCLEKWGTCRQTDIWIFVKNEVRDKYLHKIGVIKRIQYLEKINKITMVRKVQGEPSWAITSKVKLE